MRRVYQCIIPSHSMLLLFVMKAEPDDPCQLFSMELLCGGGAGAEKIFARYCEASSYFLGPLHRQGQNDMDVILSRTEHGRELRRPRPWNQRSKAVLRSAEGEHLSAKTFRPGDLPACTSATAAQHGPGAGGSNGLR